MIMQGCVVKQNWMVSAALLLVGAVSGFTQTPAAAKTPSPLEQTLIASEKSLLVGVDGKLLEHQEAVDDLGDSDLVELTPYDIRVVAVSEDAAIVTYDAIVRRKPEEDQGPPPRYQHFSSVWVKQAEAWKLTFHQATAAHWGDW